MSQVKIEALQISMNLSLWMDNTEELYRLKLAWAELYAKRMRRQKFDLDKAIKGMETLRTKVQASYNENIQDRITIKKEHLPIVLKELCVDVMRSIFDNNQDLQLEVSDYITKLCEK